MDYATGACSPAESLVVGVHLEFCGICRRMTGDLLTMGGVLLDSIDPAFVSPQMFNKTLQAIGREKPAVHAGSAPTPGVPRFAAGWPRPLREKVNASALRRWRWLPAGFRALRVPFPGDDARLWVLRAPGGRGPFKHTHASEEWTVVLQGGFSDESGTYAAGDFVSAGPGHEHRTVAEPGEGCVCVLLIRAEPVYTTWAGKLMAPFVRL